MKVMFVMIMFDDSANLKATDVPLQSITARSCSCFSPIRVRLSTSVILNSMIL